MEPALVARAASPLLLAACWTVTGKPQAVFGGGFILLLCGVGGLALSRRALAKATLPPVSAGASDSAR